VRVWTALSAKATVAMARMKIPRMEAVIFFIIYGSLPMVVWVVNEVNMNLVRDFVNDKMSGEMLLCAS